MCIFLKEKLLKAIKHRSEGNNICDITDLSNNQIELPKMKYKMTDIKNLNHWIKTEEKIHGEIFKYLG